ncbi:MAG TPA: Maf family nucleotide pyrophosphatase [Burkholderiales bacterium]|nr:Maf family nucleotide pyrophosphatase [Burkholderiales bacterium]
MAAAHLVLASTSTYRRELLNKLRVPFTVVAPRVDETPLSGETPDAAALRLSALKARAPAAEFPDALIIGSDQIASLNGNHIGKPGNHHSAVAQLRRMSGKELVFHTALSLYNSRTGNLQSCIVPTTVKIRHLTDAQIEHYLLKDQPYDCAGSARSEGLGIALMSSMSGEDPNALVGLPLIALTAMLFDEGWDVLTL